MEQPEEKAKELVAKFQPYVLGRGMSHIPVKHDAKLCALIAVDEIIKAISEVGGGFERLLYYQQVKLEINKL